MTPAHPTGENEGLPSTAHRVAAELHDGAMQEITLARLQLDLLGARVREDPELAQKLNDVADALHDASVRLQDLMRALTRDLDVVQTSS